VRLNRLNRDVLATLVAAPALLFPTLVPAVTVVLLSLVAGDWIWRAAAGRLPSFDSPLRWPLAIVAAMTLVGALVTPAPYVTLPKVAGIVLGLMVFRAIALLPATPRNIRRAVIAYVATGIIVLIPGVAAANWGVKSKAVARVTGALPHVQPRLPGMDDGVNPNGLAGTTLYFIPLLASFIVVTGRGAARVLSAAAIVPFVAVLVLTQSRTALLSAVMASLVIGCVAARRVRRVTALLAVVAVLALIAAGPTRVRDAVWESDAFRASASGLKEVPLTARAYLWQQALHWIGEQPLTGVGVNAYRAIVRMPWSPLSDPAHAHNIFLQTALDIGVPGLLAYCGVLLLAAWMSRQIWRRDASFERATALGLAGSLVAVHLFGLTDAIVLGAKVGVFLWAALGIIAVIHHGPGTSPDRTSAAMAARV
jgi:putative inorganic carbon (HCO3(-)) transporter